MKNQWRVLASNDGVNWVTVEESPDRVVAQQVLTKHAEGPLGQVYAYWMAGALDINRMDSK